MYFLIDKVMLTERKFLVLILQIICVLWGMYFFIPVYYNTSSKTTVNTLAPEMKQENILANRENHSNNQEEIFHSHWMEYRNNWKEEILIQSDKYKKRIFFPKSYIEGMIKKGSHPLTRKYPKFLERLHYIDQHCQDLSYPIDYELNLEASLYSVHFNDDYEVVNCLVPKAASTMWIFQFYKMKYQSNNSKLTIPRERFPSNQLLSSISLFKHMANPIETARRMQTYTKFFVQRHPFERLVSCYTNKFESPPDYEHVSIYARQIIISNYLKNYPRNRKTFVKDFRHLPTSQKREILKQINRLDSALDKFNITFTEFVNFITCSMENEDINKLDHHWKPVSRICKPCAVRYDVIIDHDNFVEESQMLVDYLQMNKPTNHPLYFKPYPRISTRDKCNKYFTRLSKGLRQKLYKLYRDDFLLFGYGCNPESESSACEGV